MSASKIFSASTILLFTLLGIAGGYLWFHASIPSFLITASSLVVGLWLMGFGASNLGKRILLTNPRLGCWLMECRILTWGILVIIGACLLIVLGVRFEPDKNAASETKQLYGAILGALTAFITTLGIKPAEDADENWVGRYAKKSFQARFQGYFKRESEGERWVYSDSFKGADGWGWKGRHTRTQGISNRLHVDKGP